MTIAVVRGMDDQGVADEIMQNVAEELGQQGGSETARPAESEDIPPAGQVWFGSTFDPESFAIRNRTTSVGAQESFALVAHLTRSVDGSDLVIRTYWNGSHLNPVFSRPTRATCGASRRDRCSSTGTWKYEFTDIGGNVLASGEVTATQDQ